MITTRQENPVNTTTVWNTVTESTVKVQQSVFSLISMKLMISEEKNQRLSQANNEPGLCESPLNAFNWGGGIDLVEKRVMTK